MSEPGTWHVRRKNPILLLSSDLSRDWLQRSMLTGKSRIPDGPVGFGREVVHHDVMHTLAAAPWTIGSRSCRGILQIRLCGRVKCIPYKVSMELYRRKMNNSIKFAFLQLHEMILINQINKRYTLYVQILLLNM